MSEVTDLVMPILQKIQQDVADSRRGLETRMTGLSDKFDALSKRMDTFEGYFTYTMGLTNRNTADINAIRQEIDVLKRNFKPTEVAP